MAKYLTREEYISSIGFFNNTALVDKSKLKKVRKLSFDELLARNMIRECVCDALYTHDEEKKKKVCKQYALFAIQEKDIEEESKNNPTMDVLDTSNEENVEREERNVNIAEIENNYTQQFAFLVREYGVLEEIIEIKLNKKII